jgi:hypothetical protein
VLHSRRVVASFCIASYNRTQDPTHAANASHRCCMFGCCWPKPKHRCTAPPSSYFLMSRRLSSCWRVGMTRHQLQGRFRTCAISDPPHLLRPCPASPMIPAAHASVLAVATRHSENGVWCVVGVGVPRHQLQGGSVARAQSSTQSTISSAQSPPPRPSACTRACWPMATRHIKVARNGRRGRRCEPNAQMSCRTVQTLILLGRVLKD